MKRKLTRSQMIYGAVLGVGVVALLVDRMTGATTAATEIASAAMPLAGNGGVAAAAAAHAPSDPATASFDAQLARRLNRLGNAAAKDAFHPGPSWGGVNLIKLGAADRVAAFEAAHTLRAVIGGGKRAQALVDSDLVTVGQAFDGFVLVSAGTMQAEFRSGQSVARLRMAGSDKSKQ